MMQEENIFDHIFYEFETYLFTYYKLVIMGNNKKFNNVDYDQNDFNVNWDSHFLHLRNLMGFFEVDDNVVKYKTDITTGTVLKYSPKEIYAFSTTLTNRNTNNVIKIWQIKNRKRKLIPLTSTMVANKTIEHLTEERYNYKIKLFDKLLSMKDIQLQVINEMIDKIVDKALLFFSELCKPTRLRLRYKADFANLEDRFLHLRAFYLNFKNKKQQQN